MVRCRDGDAAWAMHRALDGRHPADVFAFLDDASLLHVAGGSGLAGDYQGRDAILALLGRMADLTGGSLCYGMAEATTMAGGAVELRSPVHAARKGRTLDTLVTMKVVVTGTTLQVVWLSHQDQRAFDELWA